MLSYTYKCPLTQIDELTLNDFFGMFLTLQEINNKSNVPETRDATQKELDFVHRYQEIKKNRENDR